MSSYRATAFAFILATGILLQAVAIITQPAFNGLGLIATVASFTGIAGLAFILEGRGWK